MNDFYNSSKYYLCDVFNGKLSKSNIIFRIINNSTFQLKNAKEVAIESKIKKLDPKTGNYYYTLIKHQAFIKETTESSKAYLDNINSEIATLIGVEASKVYTLETENKTGIINIGVCRLHERLITINKLFERIVNLVNNKKLVEPNWLASYINTNKGSIEHLIEDEEEIKNVIELGLNIITSFFRLSDKEASILRRDYFKMIFFDLLSNNSYRDMENYSILVNADNKLSRLSPVYDYNNSLNDNKFYKLNEYYISKTSLISTLYHKYYHYIRELSRGLTENYHAYEESIELIVKCNAPKDDIDYLIKMYRTNMDVIKSLEIIHQKEFKDSKMDVALTETAINIKAVNNNQMIHQKYDNYNKDEAKELGVQINVEPIKKEPVIKNTFIIILGLIFLIAIGIGVAYLIMYYFE